MNIVIKEELVNMRLGQLLLIWLLFTSAAPFTFSQMQGHPYKYLIAGLLLFFSIRLMFKNQISLGNNVIPILLGVQTFYFLVAGIYHQDELFLRLAFQAIAIFITYIYLVNYVELRDVVKSILFVMSLMAVMGFVAFGLALAGVIHPFSEHVNPDGRVAYNYILTFSNFVVFTGGSEIVRVAGYFDEPGTFAFFLIHALVLNKLSFDNKKIEVLILICGLATMSVAFVISIFLYMIFFYIRINILKQALVLLLMVMSLFGVLYFAKVDVSVLDRLYEMTFSRFELDTGSGRVISADSRSEGIVRGWELVQERPVLGFGLTYIKDNTNYSLSNIVGPIVTQGVLGFIVLFSHVFYLVRLVVFPLVVSTRSFVAAGCMVILLMNYIQRPFVFGLFTYILLICLASLVRNNKEFKW